MLTNNNILGFGITFVDNENNIQTVNFDLISKCYKGSQDAQSAVRAFRILREQDFLKKSIKLNMLFGVIVASILETVFL